MLLEQYRPHVVFSVREAVVIEDDNKVWRDVWPTIRWRLVYLIHNHHPSAFCLFVHGLHGMGVSGGSNVTLTEYIGSGPGPGPGK